nr:hypothetical protein [Tanacetum cinerariifolium]
MSPPSFVDPHYPYHVCLLQRSLYGLKRAPRAWFQRFKKYALQLLERAHMVHCNPSRTSVDTETKLGSNVKQICLYMHDPRESRFAALKRVMRYVMGILDLGLHLYAYVATPLVGYIDADWAAAPLLA